MLWRYGAARDRRSGGRWHPGSECRQQQKHQPGGFIHDSGPVRARCGCLNIRSRTGKMTSACADSGGIPIAGGRTTRNDQSSGGEKLAVRKPGIVGVTVYHNPTDRHLFNWCRCRLSMEIRKREISMRLFKQFRLEFNPNGVSRSSWGEGQRRFHHKDHVVLAIWLCRQALKSSKLIRKNGHAKTGCLIS